MHGPRCFRSDGDWFCAGGCTADAEADAEYEAACRRTRARAMRRQMSPILHCSCGVDFAAPCIGVQEDDDGPSIGLTNCPECGSTRGWEVDRGRE